MNGWIWKRIWIGFWLCNAMISMAKPLPYRLFPFDKRVNRVITEADDSTEATDSVIVRKIKPVFSLDFRNSSFESQTVSIWGFNAGISYGPREHHITIGYYWLGYFAVKHLGDLRRDESLHSHRSYYNKNDFWFVSLIYWRNIVFHERWIVSIPLEVGGGVATMMPRDIQTDEPVGHSRREFFFPAQIGVYGQWKATRWVGLSAQIGYRYSVFQTDVKQHFSGMYYTVGAVAYPELFHWVWEKAFHRKKK